MIEMIEMMIETSLNPVPTRTRGIDTPNEPPLLRGENPLKAPGSITKSTCALCNSLNETVTLLYGTHTHRFLRTMAWLQCVR